MEIVPLTNWEAFQNRFEFLSDTEKLMKKVVERKSSDFVFRGQADATWGLMTTLQRLENKISFDFMFNTYLEKAIEICGAVDSYTGSNWNLDNGDITFNRFENMIGGESPIETYKTRKKIIEYLLYLRHCGFPSPLLDWSESPFVAAFFAFNEMSETAKEIAIFQFQEMPSGIKHVGNDNEPKIHLIPYDFNTHKRHYLQQTRYTICIKNFGVTQGFGWYGEAITASEQYNSFNNGNHRQDTLIKYTIPSSERKKALRHLDKMNISYVSLFETEDALIKTLALRKLELWKE